MTYRKIDTFLFILCVSFLYFFINSLVDCFFRYFNNPKVFPEMTYLFKPKNLTKCLLYCIVLANYHMFSTTNISNDIKDSSVLQSVSPFLTPTPNTPSVAITPKYF